MLRRDWRTGEWRVLLIALVLAVGSIATVGLFANRVGLALQQEATSLLGADLRVIATRPFSPAYRAAALQRGLHVVEIATFPSMVVYGQQNVLAEIQAVEAGYPLRGKIHIDDGTQHAAQGIPTPGTIWADKRLLQRMGLQLGNEVVIGALHMRVAARVVSDVDQSVGFASFAPRVQINAADLPASGLVQPGSRISYKMLFAGDSAQLANLRTWLKKQLVVGEKLEDVRDARPEIRTALERAEHFLGLAALTAVVLAGVAMALAASHFIMRHLDTCAMMRCLGATQEQVLRIFMYQFLLLGVLAVLLGDLLGYAAQFALVQSIESMREAALPPPAWLPLWQAAASGMALLLGFAFLPLWQLKRVPPLRVIRRELGMPPARTGLVYASGTAVLGVLFLWQAGSLKLGLTVLAGLTAGMLLFGLLAWLAVRTLAWLPLRGSHAFANLARHGRTNALQIVALSLGGMALLLLTFVRADLLESWRGRMPLDAPNRFIVNIQPDQRSAIKDFFTKQQLPMPQLFPMVRGRLIAINNHAISGNNYSEARARALVEREFNLSWSDHLPTDNALVRGAWWGQGVSSVLSVEEGIAKTLGINMGDILTYDVAGSPFNAKVVNLRKVQWDSMQVNFYVITASDMMKDYPASYLTSFYLPAEKAQTSDALIKAFPNLLLIDTDAVIEQVRQIMDQIAKTMSAVFLFTLLSGLAVLYAALLATQDERIQQAAILRTLGADSRYLRRLHLTEFAVLGALSGLFAAAGGSLLGWVLAIKVLEIPYHPSALIWLVGVDGGIVTVTLSGWLATRRVVQMSPLQVLQSV
ncbi:MAG: putative ABC transport system permease protein [Candidatus Nitrotoga sp. SPKER]|nr:MAG: putative ABC transport system permease protein [Candidatus Nitrotoga sp. SPKER]